MLNTYHGNFDQVETNILEDYCGYTFWKIERQYNGERWFDDYYGWHRSWSPEQRIHAMGFADFLLFLEYKDGNGSPHYRPDRITRK